MAVTELVLSDFVVRRPDGVVLYTLGERRFRPGFIALTGPNGSGKSTLLNSLAGINRRSQGTVVLNGVDRSLDPRGYARRLAFQPQNFSGYPEMSGFNFLIYLLRLRGVRRGEAKELAAFGLAAVGLLDVDVALGAYSQGMLQRLGIAYVALSGAPLALFDEPFAGIDPPGRAMLLDWLEPLAADRILIICTHHVDELMDRGASQFDLGSAGSDT